MGDILQFTSVTTTDSRIGILLRFFLNFDCQKRENQHNGGVALAKEWG
jgi:hypothetical protein